MHRHVTFREKNSFLVYSATLYEYIIDIKKIYPDGQSVLSSMRVEPFAVLFWALWQCLYLVPSALCRVPSA